MTGDDTDITTIYHVLLYFSNIDQGSHTQTACGPKG